MFKRPLLISQRNNIDLLTSFPIRFATIGAIKEFSIEKLNGYHSEDELKLKDV
jgi:hypothetical protein